jgi:DNA polymerase III gamma/tau subunit
VSVYQLVRPDNFRDVVGNSATVGALTVLVKQKTHSHCILLSGPSGCGKTTLARILAKEFGSTTNSTITLNGNNTRGIETIREMSSNAHLMGMGSSTKTYIIDESHQLTKTAQEGLLDIIEDNPSHCYFILCTTEPENLIKTVRNRCSEYTVDILSSGEIMQVLKPAVAKLNIKIHEDILEVISLTCGGSSRVALVQLEQVMGIDDVGTAIDLLEKGTERDAKVLDLLKLLIMAPEMRLKKWERIIKVFSLIDDNPEKIRRAILTFLFNKLRGTDNEEIAKDITYLLKLFSVSTYYSGKAGLGALVARACFERRFGT